MLACRPQTLSSGPEPGRRRCLPKPRTVGRQLAAVTSSLLFPLNLNGGRHVPCTSSSSSWTHSSAANSGTPHSSCGVRTWTHNGPTIRVNNYTVRDRVSKPAVNTPWQESSSTAATSLKQRRTHSHDARQPNPTQPRNAVSSDRSMDDAMECCVLY